MIFDFALFQAEYPLALAAVAFIFGALIGSFLNVVVYRLPIMLNEDWNRQAVDILSEQTEDASLKSQLQAFIADREEAFNLIVPNSRCPNCDAEIKPWHNIPILGYLFLRGRCNDCMRPISARYPIVEALTAVLTMLVVMEFGLNLQGLAACVLTWSLISLALIDYDTQLLPDDITLLFLWLGLTANFFGFFVSLPEAFIGACAGYLLLWFVFQAFKLLTGKEGMGYGDFKMLAMLGAWLGAEAIPLIILLSSLSGALLGGILIATGRDRDKPLKFGPFLAIAGWIALIWGNELVAWYLAYAIQTS